MTAEILTTEPVSFIAGDTVKWTLSLSDYLPADGWVLSYAFVMSGDQQTVSATDNGDGSHLVTITAAESVDYKVGIYRWQAYVTKGAERYKVREGRVEVKPNFATQSSGYDGRSHVKKVLEALQSMIEGKATKDQMSYTIANRSIERMPVEDLIKWKNHYERLYQNELKAENLANGGVPGNRVMVRFNNGQ